ncbi:MAG: hypothetical protein DDT18_01156 [Actinobacteria bacterium]|nr:hypothetical protein [Actinomycetota bacterium]
MKKEIIEEIEKTETKLQELKDKLARIENCRHEWREVEVGEGEYDFQCRKCLLLKSET